MTEKNVQIAQYGMTVQLDFQGPVIYVTGHDIDEAKIYFRDHDRIAIDCKLEIAQVLAMAQSSLATLREFRTDSVKRKIRFCFEFKLWEDFLEFKGKMEKLSQ